MTTKEHWETIYKTKQPNEVSWTQDKPNVSLDYIRQAQLPKSAAIIDVGGGDSQLVDYLLAEGYSNLTVLDISAAALERAQQRLGAIRAESVNWIVADITQFQPTQTYDFWHDRAVFHFLIDPVHVTYYREMVSKALKKDGQMLMATFSQNGPIKCSGLEIKQYDKDSLTACFSADFTLKDTLTADHITPFATAQNFLFCNFIKK